MFMTKSKTKVPELKDLHLFDSCVTLGRFVNEVWIDGVSDLLAIMDRYQIEEALVHEFHARAVYPLEHANRRLLEQVRGQPRLHPEWVLEPPLRPGAGAAGAVVSEMLGEGVRAARLRMRAKGALPWIWEDLLSSLEAHLVPCFLDFGPSESTLGELSDLELDTVRTLALQHPGLPMILSHVMGGLGVHPGVLYLLRRTPNVYLDITGILEYWRTAAAEVGAERVLFASGMPFTDPGILAGNVQYALDLDDNAKKMICGDNLRRLLGGVR
jgi:predicted TIM-barrel fold metal-dependent hydrolase